MAGAGVCSPWATVDDIPSNAPCSEYGFDEILLEDCLEFASNVLYEFTGRRWPGECSDTIRPCGMRSTVGWGRYVLGQPVAGTAGGLAGWCGCYRTRECGCHHLSEIKLPGYPVTAVTEVKIDGMIIDPARYRVDDQRWLVYLPDETGLDPRQAWPCCQRIDLDDTEDGTFSITYSFGTVPDRGGVMSAATLACQLALAFGGSADAATKCKLPKRITSIVRQGITIAVLDPFTLFKDGQTGLAEVDLWISSKLVGAKRRRATVYAIGSGRRVRRTG